MVTITRMLTSEVCQWCGKQKDEVCEVRLDNEASVLLCWNDLKRTVKLRMLTTKGAEHASGKTGS